MRTQLLVGGAMCFATVALIFAGSARADPPEKGAYQALSTPIIACDTKDEMKDVVEAIKVGKLKEKLAELVEVKDNHNEPVCIYSQLSPVAFGESEHLGQIKDHDRIIDAWIAHVGNRNTDFYVLWGEEVKSDPV